MNFNQKVKKGMVWSLIDNLSKQLVHFAITIILARLLVPSDYGLIGMCSVFISLGSILIDSGFSIALIRKNEVSNLEYNSVFILNLTVAVIFYIFIYLIAPSISNFYHEPKLTAIVQYLGLVVIINSFSLIHKTILTKEINFKSQTIITLFSIIGGGFLGVSMAILDYGVYSLVAQAILSSALSAFLYFYFSNWKPKFQFSLVSIKCLFKFSSNLLITDLVNIIYNNIYYIMIGKYFSASNLGYYTRAESTVSLLTNNLTNTIKRVSYPALAKVKDNNIELIDMYRRLIRNTVFFSFPLILGLAVVSDSFVYLLLGEKWMPSSILIKLTCLAGLFMPLIIFNLNSINVKGNSRLYLKLQMSNKVMLIPSIFIGFKFGIEAMLFSFAIISLFYYFITAFFSSKLLEINWSQQIKDILPYLLISIASSSSAVFISVIISNHWLLLLCQVSIAIFTYTLLCEVFKINEFQNLKQKIKSFILSK